MFLISEFRILSNIQDGDLYTKSNIKLLKLPKSTMFYRVLPSLLDCLPSIPAWCIYNIPNACQDLIFTYQHAKVIIIFQFGMPMCQKHANFLIWGASMPKSRPILQLFFKRIVQFLDFSIMLNICTFQ